MKARWMQLVVPVVLVTGVVAASDSNKQQEKKSRAVAKGGSANETFTATLSGDQEVPLVDTQTTGRAEIEINDTATAGEFTLTVNDGVRVQQAHIHCGVAGVNGPIVVFLAGFHDRGWDVNGEWVSNATFRDSNITNPACGRTVAELVQAMREGRTYANVHTVANPGGEIRGQIQQK